jgi:hypothetical protein
VTFVADSFLLTRGSELLPWCPPGEGGQMVYFFSGAPAAGVTLLINATGQWVHRCRFAAKPFELSYGDVNSWRAAVVLRETI